MADENLEDPADYEEEEEDLQVGDKSEAAGDVGKGHYVGVNASGFKDLMLKQELTKATVDCGFESPSEVQNECIPAALMGENVICQAKSGMGKTAVFVLSTLQLLQPKDGEVHVLVLAHTRELAFQISKEYSRFCKYLPEVKIGVFYGGTPFKEDLEKLKQPPHIVVGTPGRILDLTEKKGLKLDKLKIFVMDECDRLLEATDMRRQVQNIFKVTPHEKQVMMFSATLSKEIRPVCKKFCLNPREIFIDDETKLTLHGLQQFFVKLAESEKNRKLNDLLDALQFNQVVIFVSNKKRATVLSSLLEECNFPSICIHAGLEQPERLKRYEDFKNFQHRILVATDLFGRGIDIQRVNIVINYDFPEESDQYLHRVGRAGRFGTKGLAISFVSSQEDADKLADVQQRFEVRIPALPDFIDASTYM